MQPKTALAMTKGFPYDWHMQSPADEVRHVLTDTRLLTPTSRVLVGVSGGLDSVVLLNLMLEWAATGGATVEVAHFNHGLRGKESDKDERFVRELARVHRVSCHVGKMRDREGAAGESLEMTARRERHRFLAGTALANGFHHVVLGHHADDQLETVFLRLFRGEGASLGGMGFSSPSPANARVTIIRPLLGLRRHVLEEWARARRIKFREDASNRDEAFLRNRIRRKLIPLIGREFKEPALAGILRAAAVCGAESAWAEAEARAWLKNPSRSLFSGLPVALQRRLIRAQLIDLDIEATYPRIEWLRENVGKLLSVAPDAGIRRSAAGLIERSRPARLPAHNPAELALELTDRPATVNWAGISIDHRRAALRKSSSPLGKTLGRERFDADAVGDFVTLRHWRPGDRFRPIGMQSPVKLQDLLVSAKIPAAQRRQLVVAEADGRGIFWVEGLRIAEGFKLQSTSARYLEWRWKRPDAFLAAATGID